MSAQATSPMATSGDVHRGRQHRVVGVGVLQLVEQVEGRVVDGAVHGGGGHAAPAPRTRRRGCRRCRRRPRPGRSRCPGGRTAGSKKPDRMTSQVRRYDQHVALQDPHRAAARPMGIGMAARRAMAMAHWTSRRRNVTSDAARPDAAVRVTSTARLHSASGGSMLPRRCRAPATPRSTVASGTRWAAGTAAAGRRGRTCR